MYGLQELCRGKLKTVTLSLILKPCTYSQLLYNTDLSKHYSTLTQYEAERSMADYARITRQ